jgi:hypothetical protein
MRFGYLAALGVILLGGCSFIPAFPTNTASNTDPDAPRGSISHYPNAAIMARPEQNLRGAQLEEDGCFWTLHEGPVETTRIPLVTNDSEMICLRQYMTGRPGNYFWDRPEIQDDTVADT